MKLNIGCGTKKLEGWHNIDKSPRVNPDEVVDLECPLPFEDSSFYAIQAHHVLEHLGDTSSQFLAIIKELYRVSADGCIWDVRIPHWRHDNCISDPTHKRILTYNTFLMFDAQRCHGNVGVFDTTSALAFELGIDLENIGYQVILDSGWIAQGRSKEETDYALNHGNNVAEEFHTKMRVHKPPRFTE